MGYLCLDLETSTKTSYGRIANCFDADNYIVACGYKPEDKEAYTIYGGKDPVTDIPLINVDVLIGFNIKFDLLYLWGMDVLQQWLINGGKIFDCQLCEYMLSGQTNTYPSLDQCSNKYGGTLKDDRVKALWKAGCDTIDIPKDILLEYLEHDAKNTELVYLAQMKQLDKLPKLKKLIELQMEGLLATTEMEFNGCHIDLNTANANKNYLIAELDRLDKGTIQYIKKNVIDIEQGHLNLNSNQHMSALFFGGIIKYTYKQAAGVFKTGERKGETKYLNNIGYYKCKELTKPHHTWKTKTEGIYSVDEGTLTALNKRNVKLAQMLLERRSLAKELNTYYESMIKQVQPDGVIHHSLNHCATATGRLSSTKPNLQNIPRDTKNPWDVKRVFTSRFKDGVIIEADFKGAEVFAAAFESQDTVMIADLETKVDTHKIRATEIWDIPIEEVTDEQKQIAKVASFQLLYGAGVSKLATTQFSGDEDLAKKFVDSYYDRYSTLKQWQNRLLGEVDAKRVPGNTKTDKGYPAGTSTIESCTGRRYTFNEYDAPEWLTRSRGVHTTFSPTEIKNYLIQGLATADIVPIMLGRLFRVMIKHRDKALMINTIHDSVLLDCKPEHCTIVSRTARIILQDVKEAMKDLGLDWNVPVSVEVKQGNSWGTMQVVGGELNECT